MHQHTLSALRPRASVLVALLVAAAVVCASPGSPRADDAPAKASAASNAQVSPDDAKALADTLERARRHLVLQAPVKADVALKAAIAMPGADDVRVRLTLMQGLAAIQQGHGERAAKLLGQVEDADVADALPHVLLLRARAHTMAAQYDQALAQLDLLLRAFPDSFPAHLARATRPDVLVDAGRCDDAIGAYAKLLRRYPEYPQRHVAMYRRAQCLLSTGKTRDGARAMQDVWLTFPWKEEGLKARLTLDTLAVVGQAPADPDPEALLERGRHLRKRKHWDSAQRELERLLGRVQKDNQAPTKLSNEIRLQLALIDYDRQDFDRAFAQLKRLEADSNDAQRGAGLNRNMLLKFLQRCAFRMGDAAASEAYLKTRLKGASSKQRHKDLADFYWSVGQYRDARTHFDASHGRRDKDDWKYAYMLYKAQDYDAAADLLEHLIQASSKNRSRHRYWLARTRERQRRYDDAKALYRQLADAAPFAYYGYQASNRLHDLREHLSTTPTGPVGQAPASTQDPDLAADITPVAALPTGTVQPNPDAPRQARVYWSGPDQAPEPQPISAAALRQTPPDAWLSAYVGQPHALGAVRQAAAEHGALWPKLKTAALLHEIGLSREARRELRHVTLELKTLKDLLDDDKTPSKSKPLDLKPKRWAHLVDWRRKGVRGFWGLKLNRDAYPIPSGAKARKRAAARQTRIQRQHRRLSTDLKAALREVGDYHMVRRIRLDEGGWSRTSTAAPYTEAWSELHPRAFPLLVQKYAAQEGLNPYLLWALMTVESAYNPDSVSYADARGLLQVIPKTGNKVAADIHDNHFGPYDLLTPETSIRHGAWYFARLVRKFNGQEPLAIASYNGGPHNVQKWLAHKHDQPLDEFVEEIPFKQARGYTKKVLRFVALYRSIYADTYGLYVGQDLNPERRVDPRY